MARYHHEPPSKRASRPPVANPVKEHNLRVKSLIDAHLVHVARYGLLFPVDGTRPKRLLLPCREDWDPACGCPVWAEDLSTEGWIEGPQTVTPVNHFPGTHSYLLNGYDIITRSRDNSEHLFPNTTVRHMFCIEWLGPLLVVKRGRRDRGRAVNITSPEISLISTLVERWLQLQDDTGSEWRSASSPY